MYHGRNSIQRETTETRYCTSFVWLPSINQLPRYVRALRGSLPAWCRTRQVRVALAEALANAIVHGAYGLGARPESDGLTEYLRRLGDADARAECYGQIRVTVAALSPDAVSVNIADPGRGFDWRRVHFRAGHGLSLVVSAVDGVFWNPTGNAIRLHLRRPAGRKHPVRRRAASRFETNETNVATVPSRNETQRPHR